MRQRDSCSRQPERRASQGICGFMHTSVDHMYSYLVAWRGELRPAGAPVRGTAGGGGIEAHPVPPKGLLSSSSFGCASGCDGVGGSEKGPGSGVALAAAAAGGSGARGGSWKTLPRRVEDCSDAPLPALLPTWLLRVLCRPRACAPGCRVSDVDENGELVGIAGPVRRSVSQPSSHLLLHSLD